MGFLSVFAAVINKKYNIKYVYIQVVAKKYFCLRVVAICSANRLMGQFRQRCCPHRLTAMVSKQLPDGCGGIDKTAECESRISRIFSCMPPISPVDNQISYQRH